MLLAVPAIGRSCYGDVGLAAAAAATAAAALAPSRRVPTGGLGSTSHLTLHSMSDACHAAGMR